MSIQPIDAEVPVIKLVIDQIGVDVSFTQPSGILTAYFWELCDEFIGKNHLLKRSLILTQNYLMNE